MTTRDSFINFIFLGHLPTRPLDPLLGLDNIRKSISNYIASVLKVENYENVSGTTTSKQSIKEVSGQLNL